MDNVIKILAQAIIDEYKVKPDPYTRTYCLFCGTTSGEKVSIDAYGQNVHHRVWEHGEECPVPVARKALIEVLDQPVMYMIDRRLL